MKYILTPMSREQKEKKKELLHLGILIQCISKVS